jgi:hypothetical protein
MNKVLVAILGALLAALLGFAGTASAAPITLNFTGTVTRASDPGDVGKTVTGKVVAGGTIDDQSSPSVGAYSITYDTGTYSFQVGSGPAFTAPTALRWSLYSPPGFTYAQSTFYIGPLSAPSNIFMILTWDPTSQPVSLATFPANDILSAAYFGVAMASTQGAAWFSPTQDFGFKVTSYSMYSTATTPLPAAAWFLLTALGGLGFAGWRRRTQVEVPASVA